MDAKYYKKIIEELIELMDDGVYIVDEEGVGIFYNKAMASMEKVNMDDVLGKKFHEAFPDFRLGDSTMFRALKKKEPTLKKQQTYKNLYGKEITTVNSTIPIIVDDEAVAAIEVAKDITDIRKMSDKLLSLQEDKIEQSDPEAADAKAGDGDKTSSVAGAPTRLGIKKYTFEDIYGQNERFVEVVNRAKKAANNDANVFIYGETGTGKELFAQSIHYAGARASRPFLAQNCAAIPETLLEGILFGTSKGSFTGAVDRAGLFEQANGGTLLLDEVSAMPYDLQSKLLRVLQENYVRRVGGNKDIPINVRIITTVNEPPEELIKQGKLRKDLYYRINVINLSIPSLRERLDDIQLLTERFLEKFNERFGKELWMVSDGAVKRLQRYDYPGNVRELENIIEQTVSMADREHVLTEKLLSMPQNSRVPKHPQLGYEQDMPLDEYMAAVEERIINEALVACDGNISHAAAMLQIKRQTLQHKLKKYHVLDTE